MYNQTVQNIKVIILPLDGIIFDLNRYRYNYYKHYCNSKNVQLNKYDFYSHLCSMYDMYKGLPLSQNIDIGPFNAKIERELSQYLHYKGLQPKEGLLELIEYAQQKDMKIAVMSTHRTKDAVEYLKLAKIYNKFHFIIGSDTTSLPLPSSQILETIRDFFKVDNKEVLVISPFLSLNHAAYSLNMNIIFCHDLMEAQAEEKSTSYKTVKNLFEVLNILLFDRYENAEIYSPILGMNNQMTKDELDHIYEKLKKTYNGDTEILNVIEQTYQYHISCLNEHNIKDASIPLSYSSQNIQRFTFDDEDEPEQKIDIDNLVSEETAESNDIDDKNDNSHPIMRTLDDNEEKELSQLLQQLKQKEQKRKDIFISDDAFDNEDTSIEETQEFDDSEEEKHSIFSIFINFIYICSISFLIIFISLIFKIAFIHQFESQNGFFGIINMIFNGYILFVENIFKVFFNGLHAIIYFIPSYEQYCHSMSLFSEEGIRLFHVFIFNSLIIIFFKLIYSFIQRRYHQTDVEENE